MVLFEQYILCMDFIRTTMIFIAHAIHEHIKHKSTSRERNPIYLL